MSAPFTVTFFKNKGVATKSTKDMSLPELRDLILKRNANSKGVLPWVKLATFGDLKSDKGSLRHDANVLTITGPELDYDGEEMSFDEAVDIIKQAHLYALIYTSPSHTVERPRWRILLPTSCALPPGERTKLAERVNGLFGGIFSGESFTLSHSYYFGSVKNNPAHQAVVIEGDYIDQRDDLDATAMGKAAAAKEQKTTGFEAHLAQLGDGPGLDGVHKPLLRAVASYVATHAPALDRGWLKARLRAAIAAAPTNKSRPYLDGDKHIDDLIDSAVAKFGQGDDDIKRLNASHAVLPIGDKTRVVTFGELEDFPGRETIIMTQTLGDFASLHNKYRHEYEDDKGKPVSIPMGTYWITSRHRRQYDGGMAFMPGRESGNRLNLWRGFGVQPRKPDGKSGAASCRKFLSFAHEVICSGDAAHYDYLIKREATIVQKRIRTEVALALRSTEEGVGKGRYEKHMGHLLGNHAMQITQPRHIVGNFNPHLETLLRLVADEALFVGNHEHRNVLFGLVTEGKLTIEPKGCGVYTASNYLNITIISNSPHFIPVSGTARRFFVPTVSVAHMQDRPYFRAIEDELVNEGGYEALLYHLLHEIDLRDFDVGVVPRTAGLAQQAAYGRRGIEGLVEMVCNEGRVPCEHPEWPGFTITSGKEDDFYRFIDRQKDRELSGYGALTVQRRLAKEWGCTTGERKREPGTNDRTCGFHWPALAELRMRFAERFGVQSWTNAECNEWTVEGREEEVTKIVLMAGESKKAYRVSDGGEKEAWLPISQIIDSTPLDDGRTKIKIPRWLFEQKGMETWEDAPKPQETVY